MVALIQKTLVVPLGLKIRTTLQQENIPSSQTPYLFA